MWVLQPELFNRRECDLDRTDPGAQASCGGDFDEYQPEFDDGILRSAYPGVPGAVGDPTIACSGRRFLPMLMLGVREMTCWAKVLKEEDEG
ncbi:MAG TPA: hypothetical protein EYN40_01540 [Planctomycetes bacterium]|nr:hypothetical protein [Planctomycetota bacterium]